MKISKILALVTVVLAVTSVAYAGPHNYDTFTGNDTTNGAALWYPLGTAPGDFTIGGNDVQVTDGSNDGTSYDFGSTYQWTNPAALPQDCSSQGLSTPDEGYICYQPLVYNTDAITAANFTVLVTPFENGSYDNIDTSLASFTTGATAYFYTADTSVDGPASYDEFVELDINIAAAPANDQGDGAPAVPAGVWRLGFGVNLGNGTSAVALALTTISQTPGQDGNGSYAINATQTCRVEGPACASTLYFVDSEFDPSGSVPEPTTMLLLGSGLMFVARRFKR